MIEITSEAQILALIQNLNLKDLFIFKHSTRCPISAVAFDEFRQFADSYPDSANFTYIDHLQYPEISKLLEKTTSIKHETPQVIYFSHGIVKWTASHNAINKEALKNQIVKK